MTKFSDKCELPNGDMAYGLIDIQVRRNGKTIFGQAC